MQAHRIALRKYAATAASAFSGVGGLYGNGRWHTQGRLIIYAAQYRSLAMIEILVHLKQGDRGQPFVTWPIEVPDREILVPTDLPTDWRTNLDATRAYGNAWIDQHVSPALRLPSVIVPSEFNLVINPAHPRFDLKWVGQDSEPVVFDDRLIR